MGCGGSKPAAAALAALAAPGPAAQSTPAAQQDKNLLAEAKPEEAKPTTSLKIQIASAHGLRIADLIGNKSDVYVEVEIEGKSDSKVTTAVVTCTASKKEGAGENEKNSIDVDLQFVGELKGYLAGDKILFTVKDKDFLKSDDSLGKATVTQGGFGGKLVLEGAGEGFQAHLMVQLGNGTGMEEAKKVAVAAAASMAAAASSLAAAAALAASGDAMKQAEAAKAAQEAVEKAAREVKEQAAVIEGLKESSGSGWCSC